MLERCKLRHSVRQHVDTEKADSGRDTYRLCEAVSTRTQDGTPMANDTWLWSIHTSSTCGKCSLSPMHDSRCRARKSILFSDCQSGAQGAASVRISTSLSRVMRKDAVLWCCEGSSEIKADSDREGCNDFVRTGMGSVGDRKDACTGTCEDAVSGLDSAAGSGT